MSSAKRETTVSLNGRTNSDKTGEPPKVGVKRKRTPSQESPGNDNKRKGLVNGVEEVTLSSEMEERERVAILDAGAQYGKVREMGRCYGDIVSITVVNITVCNFSCKGN